jgi:hypothetical protein
MAQRGSGLFKNILTKMETDGYEMECKSKDGDEMKSKSKDAYEMECKRWIKTMWKKIVLEQTRAKIVQRRRFSSAILLKYDTGVDKDEPDALIGTFYICEPEIITVPRMWESGRRVNEKTWMMVYFEGELNLFPSTSVELMVMNYLPWVLFELACYKCWLVQGVSVLCWLIMR